MAIKCIKIISHRYFARSFGWKQNIIPKLLTNVGFLQQLSASAQEYLEKVYEVMDRYYPPKRYRDLSAPPLNTANLIREFEQRDYNDTRPAASDLQKILKDRWATFSRQYPSAASGWRHADDLTRSYLIARACDFACFGQEVANLTFPLPKLSWAEEFVSAVVKIIEGFWVPTPSEKERQDVEYWRRRRAPERARELARISYSPPETLSARIPSDSERTVLKNACLAELSGSSVLTVLNDFVRFCDLLALPENHIQVPSTQYIETQGFYCLSLEPNLFGGWSLVREWGRIGQTGRMNADLYVTLEAAQLALDIKLREKGRKGYHGRYA